MILPPSTGVCTGASATFTVVPSGGTAPYTINWSGPGGFVSTSDAITITNAQPINAGFYRAVVRDASGGTSSCQAQLNVFPNPECIVEPPTNRVSAGDTATFTVSVTPTRGTPPFQFDWTGPNALASSNATITITNAQPVDEGSYTVLVTDANGCTNRCQARLIIECNPICRIVPVSSQLCVGATLSLAAIGSNGVAPYTFSWSGPSGFLAAGATISIPSITASAAGTYIAVVTDASGCSNTCSAEVTVVPCNAGIAITKEIVCRMQDGCAFFDGSRTATGVRAGNQCPAFCYRITVANTSEPGIALDNLMVSDDELDLSSCTLPSRLGPVGSPTASVACIVSNVTHCKTLTNRVRADAVAVLEQTGTILQTVRSDDDAVAVVMPISVECSKFISSPADLDPGDGPSIVTLPDDPAYPVTYGVAVTNSSSMPLMVFVTDPTLANCPLPAEFTNGFSLAAGETRIWPDICVANLQCGVDPLDGGRLVNTIFVQAVVDASLTNVCTYTADGDIITAFNSCEAIVQCIRAAGCRVTGGGRQDLGPGRGSLVWPLRGGNIDCLGDVTVRHVTHAGQVGAPIGRISEFDPDSECIQGNWKHVRHAHGGRQASFSARSFDSLMCACLGNGSEFGGVVGKVYHRDQNGLGPQQRKACVNKIAFSGVGDYTCNKGARQPRTVLFRVDIEDQSEPRRSLAGSIDPADRYRIRIWILNAQELAASRGAVNALNDPYLCNFRRAIAATAANTPLTDGAVTPSGDAVPLGTAVFGVRAPDVDDGGEMLYGNYQIHAEIKECAAPEHNCP